MATTLGISRRELKDEHRRVVTLARQLQQKFLEVRTSLNRFADGYIESEQHNPWARSKILHELVESITTESFLSNLHQSVKDSNICPEVTEQPRGTIADLMKNMAAINALHSKKEPLALESEGEKRPLISGKKPQGKGKKLLRQVKKMTGFGNEAVEDEDVMSNDRLVFCLRTAENRIKVLHDDLSRMYVAINKLSVDYSAVRAQCSCCKYCNLKRIIETVIEETDAETVFEP